MMHKNKATQFVATAVLTMSLLSGCSSNTAVTENQAPVPEETATEDAASTEIAGTDKDSAETNSSSDSLVITEQGMFSAGGITVTSDGTFDPENHWEETGAGQTSHVDHANVLYQIPENETGLPMVFLHGYGQSRMGWMTTPDGREG